MTSLVGPIRRSITASSALRAPGFAYIVSVSSEYFGTDDALAEDTRQHQCRGLCVCRRRPAVGSENYPRHDGCPMPLSTVNWVLTTYMDHGSKRGFPRIKKLSYRPRLPSAAPE
ncbi:hypothetical protein CDEST_06729 [Colletotrichum destructivum]|uniref:Uncharacterized protein n=1 Tax=Colletotrichum destructivum TaxID=34406 RepID=A0AAX4IE69_9PEZI|nr:hypothetical protein CDEST_06729 [Colletotrichum destructivum]